MFIKVLVPEAVSQIAAGKVVGNALDFFTSLEAIIKLCELQQKEKDGQYN